MNEEIFKNLNDLTIIVTLHDRRNTLPRLFQWYKDYGCSVICVDSSPLPKPEFVKEDDEAKKRMYSYLPSNMQYHFNPGFSYLENVSFAIEKVKTKYCVVVCDDDFLIPIGAATCVDFLEKNSDFSAAFGQEAALYDCPPKILYDILEYKLRTEYVNNYASSDHKVRMRHAWNYFDGLWVHSITRTNTLKKVIDTHLSWPDDLFDLYFYDKTHALALAYEGNFFCVSEFYIVRSNEYLAHGKRFSHDHEEYPKDKVSFKKDFLKLDLSPITKSFNIDRALLERGHKNLCSSSVKNKAYRKLSKDFNLICEFIGEDKHSGLIGIVPMRIAEKNNPFVVTLSPRLGPGADSSGEFWTNGSEDEKMIKGRLGNIEHCWAAMSVVGSIGAMSHQEDWSTAGTFYPIFKEVNYYALTYICSMMFRMPLGDIMAMNKELWRTLIEEVPTYLDLTPMEQSLYFNHEITTIKQFIDE